MHPSQPSTPQFPTLLQPPSLTYKKPLHCKMAWLHFRNQRTHKSPAILVTHRIIALLSLHLLWSLSLNPPHQPLLKSESHSNTIPIICLVPFQYYSHCLPGLIPRLSHYLVSFPDCLITWSHSQTVPLSATPSWPWSLTNTLCIFLIAIYTAYP